MCQKVAEARIWAARKLPYMRHQIMALMPVAKPGIGTMCVDEYGRMYYDPAFLTERDLGHLGFVVAHEVIHVWSRHCKRSRKLLGEKPDRSRLDVWRQAVDASVNDTLEQTGLRCPDEGVTPAKLGLPRNKTAEEYFNLLLDRQEQERQEQEKARQQQQEAQQGEDGEEKRDRAKPIGMKRRQRNSRATRKGKARIKATTKASKKAKVRAAMPPATSPAKRANPAMARGRAMGRGKAKKAMERESLPLPRSAVPAPTASNDPGRMARLPTNTPAWPSMSRTSSKPPWPRRSKRTRSSVGVAACRAV